MSRRTPKYRLHKPSGQDVVTLNGRDYYLGKWNSAESRRNYDQRLAEWLTDGRRIRSGGRSYKAVAATIIQFPGRPSRFINQNVSTAKTNKSAQINVIAAGSARCHRCAN